MFILCVESSHRRGMGHLFRMLHLGRELRVRGHQVEFVLNFNSVAHEILKRENFPAHEFSFVESGSDKNSNSLEKLKQFLREKKPQHWVNDRLNTPEDQARIIKEQGIHLVTFDDRGEGASLSDLHICALSFDGAEKLAGKKVLRGPEYLILNPGIEKLQRQREELKKIFVNFGGSDTHGLTEQLARVWPPIEIPVTAVLGPSFEGIEKLMEIKPTTWTLKKTVPSLLEEMNQADFAFTAGGITAFEAQALGLPAVIVAAEDFEIPIAKFLESQGGVKNGGFRSFTSECFDFPRNLSVMSQKAKQAVSLQGLHRILEEIL